jgi:mono/diheme cytochrome c family protein
MPCIKQTVRKHVALFALCPSLFLAAGNLRADSTVEDDTRASRGARWIESSERSVELGKATFGTCAGCHGQGATGMIGIGPRIASKSYLAAASDDFLIRTIKDGRLGTTMIAWGAALDETQQRDVLAYIRATFGK